MGTSGSGKSTLLQLATRLYDPAAGRVLLCGVALPTLSVPSLRALFGVVEQEPKLLQARVWENIAWGLPPVQLSETIAVQPKQSARETFAAFRSRNPDVAARVVACARMADAHGFITSEMAEGFDTILLAGGRGVSGGQKQRIAIARALMRDPLILLLDEATSALDSTSERAVQAALTPARGTSEGRSRTTIVVAHRLSTIRDADFIVVFDRGVIVERGTHDELLAGGSVYRALLEMQGLLPEMIPEVAAADETTTALHDINTLDEPKADILADAVPGSSDKCATAIPSTSSTVRVASSFPVSEEAPARRSAWMLFARDAGRVLRLMLPHAVWAIAFFISLLLQSLNQTFLFGVIGYTSISFGGFETTVSQACVLLLNPQLLLMVPSTRANITL